MYVNIGGTWRESKDIYANINGTWRTVTNKYTNIGGVWREELSFFTATGGTVTTSGDYKIHKFTSSGTFSVTYGGTLSNLYVVGGGGGGGLYSESERTRNGGGGGGGYVAVTSKSISTGNYSIVIGAGGAINVSGGNSSALGYTAYGGGYGGTWYRNGANGGCGGGAGYLRTAGTGSQGGNGMTNSGEYTALYIGGGGGGAGGDAYLAANKLFYPGPGVYLSDIQTTVGVGGYGTIQNGAPPYPVANTGSGGAGWCFDYVGSGGTSGIVVIKYKYK